MDLALGERFALQFKDHLQRKGAALGCPPTVLQELAHLAATGDMRQSELAVQALSSFTQWEMNPWMMEPVGNGICEQVFRRMVQERLLPDQEQHDGFILAETALAGIHWLVTSDRHLLNIPEDALKAVLTHSHLAPVTICRPRRLAELIERRGL